jgi:hypothetical protein
MDTLVQQADPVFKAIVTGIQGLGLKSLGLMIAVAAIANWFGGERALRAVAIAVGVVIFLFVVLMSAGGLGTGFGNLIHPA